MSYVATVLIVIGILSFLWDVLRFWGDLLFLTDDKKKEGSFFFGVNITMIAFGTTEYELKGYTIREFRFSIIEVRYTYKKMKDYKPFIHNSSPITHHSK